MSANIEGKIWRRPLSVVMLSNLMAIFLQRLALRLGIVAERDLAQACRDHFSPPVAFALWVLCEIAIIACDLAEVIGSAIALNLLFGIPLIYGVLLTAFDVMLLLLLQNRGFRWLEAVVVTLVLTVGICFGVQIALSEPSIGGILRGFVPTAQIVMNPEMLYIAIGILGATVMPHNLYLHSSVVQTRNYERNAEGKREALKYATIDSTLSLIFALFINAAILIVAAAVFYRTGNYEIAEIESAYEMLSPLLGTAGASTLFAVALLASGQNSTLTGTLAGQIVMEGFLNLRIRPWMRRLITRLIAIVPAVFVTYYYGSQGTGQLLVFSQVVLSMQLSFAVFPLVMFTCDQGKMGEFANSSLTKITGYIIASVIAALNGWLLFQTFSGWLN
ncbi:MAG: Nramp family divalent metal transporter [Acidobacteria bacterium]|nr:Nramp family divalent metal transporter [Acidobacteriota bacterium]